MLHHLPTNVLLPHLIHLFLLGLVTSRTISGDAAKTYRTTLSLSAVALASIDIYLVTSYSPPLQLSNAMNPSRATQWATYWTAVTVRPLCICIFDILAAGLVYLGSTNRLPFLFPAPETTSLEKQQRQQMELTTQSVVALQTALTKLRALGVARSAIVRDVGNGAGTSTGTGGLKERDDEYWRVVVGMEGPGTAVVGSEGSGSQPGYGSGSGTLVEPGANPPTPKPSGSIWQEEEVMQAVARVTNPRDGSAPAVDVSRIGREADAFIDGVTAGLERFGE